ncbi:MAG: transposase, partial [Calditrichaeota bacterium]|nr:transposase [Calditrichota bacterium]
TVLAHHVVQCIQWYLHQKDCYLRWSSIRQALGTQQRLTSSFTTEAGKRIHIRHTSEPEAFHRFVADALGITPKPLARKKTIL